MTWHMSLLSKGPTAAQVTDIYNDIEVVLVALPYVGQLSGLPGALNAGQSAALASALDILSSATQYYLRGCLEFTSAYELTQKHNSTPVDPSIRSCNGYQTILCNAANTAIWLPDAWRIFANLQSRWDH